MIQKLVNVGNSKGLILSKDLLKVLNIREDQTIVVQPDENTQTILLTKVGTKKKLPAFSNFMNILEKVNKEYGPALKKLSEL